MVMISFLLAMAGLACIVGGATDADWLLDSAKGRSWTTAFGRRHARYFYIGGGLLLVAIAVICYLQEI